ncbi:MAG: erythromycin esterase family protein [Acidobacteria bacterium]|nr:erythromycin esterase family protein [Acidobacteriota bacterium]
MKKLLKSFAILIYISALASAQSMQSREWKNWIVKNSTAISLNGSENYNDLKFLKKIIGKNRIVQLGEGGHGMKEFFQVKARLVKFLHQEMGFEVVAFESSLYQCYRSDQFAAEMDPQKSLLDCVFGVWHTKEVLNLFEYIKKSRSSAKPLHYIGFDIQPIGQNKKDRPAFLKGIVSRVDAKYAKEVFELDSFFLREYAKNPRQRRESFRENREVFVNGYEKLAKFIEVHRAEFKGIQNEKDILVAGQTARFLAQYIRQQTAPDLKAYVELRDEGMAGNIDFIANKLYPNKKIIVWGHNAHVRYRNEEITPTKEVFPGIATRMMGSWLKDKYAEDIYTFGLYAYSGSATNNSREVYQIADPEDGMFEGFFSRAKSEVEFVDFRENRKKKELSWMFKPVKVRYNGESLLEMIMPEQYDGVICIKTVSTPEYLY